MEKQHFGKKKIAASIVATAIIGGSIFGVSKLKFHQTAQKVAPMISSSSLVSSSPVAKGSEEWKKANGYDTLSSSNANGLYGTDPTESGLRAELSGEGYSQSEIDAAVKNNYDKGILKNQSSTSSSASNKSSTSSKSSTKSKSSSGDTTGGSTQYDYTTPIPGGAYEGNGGLTTTDSTPDLTVASGVEGVEGPLH